MKHTQGKWTVYTWKDDSVAVEVEPSGTFICQVNYKEAHEERLANAKLIAAAPLLLGALEEILYLLPHSDELRIDEIRDLAEAAIASATE